LDTDGIGKIGLSDAVTEVGVVAIARVGQNNFGDGPGSKRGSQLIQGGIRLNLDDDIGGRTGLCALNWVDDPFMRQIQPIGDRQAGMTVCG
jgi:hypothetical protein